MRSKEHCFILGYPLLLPGMTCCRVEEDGLDGNWFSAFNHLSGFDVHIFGYKYQLSCNLKLRISTLAFF